MEPQRRWMPTGVMLARALGPLVAAAVVVVAARLVGLWLNGHGGYTGLGDTFPLAGYWRSGPTRWLPIPVLVGAALVWWWPTLVARLSWRWLLVGATVAAAAWEVAVTLTDGPKGFTYSLASVNEYPHDVPLVGDLDSYLPTFNRHVLDVQPTWTAHVAGHPPGATGMFVLLDRVGLGGLGWAAALCVAGGALWVPSVLVVVRELGGADFARRAALFVPLAPTVLWMAATADAVFAAVAAAGVCALTLAAGRRGPRGDLLAAIGGLALGCCLFLSFGLTLLVFPAVAVVLARRRIRPLLVGVVPVAALLALAAWAGYDWWQGLHLATERTRIGRAWQLRSTSYFPLANPADLAITLGPATIAGLGLVRRTRLALLPAAAGLAVVAAIVSNLSKGEVERIYLPFAIWLLPFAATLIGRPVGRWPRILLAAQLGWAVLITAVIKTWW